MKFRLETLLRIRKNQENKVQRDMATVNQHLFSQRDQLEQLNNRRESESGEYDKSLTGTKDVSTLQRYDQFFESSKVNRHKQEKVIEEIEQFAEKKRAELAEAVKLRRTLEILKEREREAFLKEEKKREIALLDEMASMRWMRKS